MQRYLDGGHLRRVARQGGVNHQRVANWVTADAPLPDPVETIERDEFHPFIEDQNKAYLLTFVDRATRCILNWAVDGQVSDETLQEGLDESPPARWYDSDLLAAYQDLAYDFGSHFPMNDTSQPYSVEADNAQLRP